MTEVSAPQSLTAIRGLDGANRYPTVFSREVSADGDAPVHSLIGVAVNPDVDVSIQRSKKWPEEMTDLRPILLRCGLTEEIKWGKPCYSHDGKNIVILQEMKEFLALMFFKGALLNDPEGVLEEQGPNSRSARRIRFTSVEDVARLADTVTIYIDEAIDVAEAGLEVGPPPELVLVEELRRRLDHDPALKTAFELSLIHISEPTRPSKSSGMPSSA